MTRQRYEKEDELSYDTLTGNEKTRFHFGEGSGPFTHTHLPLKQGGIKGIVNDSLPLNQARTTNVMNGIGSNGTGFRETHNPKWIRLGSNYSLSITAMPDAILRKWSGFVAKIVRTDMICHFLDYSKQ